MATADLSKKYSHKPGKAIRRKHWPDCRHASLPLARSIGRAQDHHRRVRFYRWQGQTLRTGPVAGICASSHSAASSFFGDPSPWSRSAGTANPDVKFVRAKCPGSLPQKSRYNFPRTVHSRSSIARVQFRRATHIATAVRKILERYLRPIVACSEIWRNPHRVPLIRYRCVITTAVSLLYAD